MRQETNRWNTPADVTHSLNQLETDVANKRVKMSMFRHTEMNCVVVNMCVGCRRAHSQRFCISTRKHFYLFTFFLLGERRHSKYIQEFPLSNVTLVSQANRFYSQSSSQLPRPLDSLRWQVSLQGPSNTLVMDKVSKKKNPHLHFTIKTLHKNLKPFTLILLFYI